MACEITLNNRVLVVRWGTPEERDIPPLLTAVARARESAGAPIVFVCVVPADAPAPSEQIRKRMASALKESLEHCESFHQVMIGSGFVMAAKRAVFSTIVLIGGQRHKVHVHSTLQEVSARCDPSSRREVELALKRVPNIWMRESA